MEIVQTDLKCPKCKSNNFLLHEIWKNASIEWEVENGRFDRDDGSLEPGYAYKLNATCKECEHRWQIRKATQMTNIIKD